MQNQTPDRQDYGYDKTYSAPPPSVTDASFSASTKISASDKTSTGLDANVAALLAYVLTWVTGLVFFLIEKENRFVRFHAMQAILFGAGLTVISIVLSVVLGVITYISWILGMLASLAWLVFSVVFLIGWVMCMVKAYQGKMFKLPVIGDMAEKIVNK